ncbi:hypothetical protein [Serratia symbiotica]|uniref:hypothetical protein n=1 Tax=Serratia symbiotica TaxID=138074 RepID=UPI00077BD11A|nr:hypothetical protein [Serratia symbiotica]
MADRIGVYAGRNGADDVVIHCKSHAQAMMLRGRLRKRLAECKLEMSPGKTKVVYCKDRERTEAYPEISFDFVGYTFRPRKSFSKEGELSVNFLPAMSGRAAKAIRQTVRGWDLSHRTPLSLEVMARWLNPMLRCRVKVLWSLLSFSNELYSHSCRSAPCEMGRPQI